MISVAFQWTQPFGIVQIYNSKSWPLFWFNCTNKKPFCFILNVKTSRKKVIDFNSTLCFLFISFHSIDCILDSESRSRQSFFPVRTDLSPLNKFISVELWAFIFYLGLSCLLIWLKPDSLNVANLQMFFWEKASMRKSIKCVSISLIHSRQFINHQMQSTKK